MAFLGSMQAANIINDHKYVNETIHIESPFHSHIHTVTLVLKRCVDYIHLHFIYWILNVQGNLNLNELLFDIVCCDRVLALFVVFLFYFRSPPLEGGGGLVQLSQVDSIISVIVYTPNAS